VLATGDELVEPDRAPASHQVRNSNAPMLLAQLHKFGLEGEYLGIAPDRPDRLATLVAQGLDADVLLVTGGVSVGEYDLVGRALETEGMRLLFHKVAIKPGKPLLAGRRGNCLVFGLPGNPVSAFTGFTVFVAPVLRHLMGWRDWRSVRGRARLGAPLRGRAGRETYHLAQLELRDGVPMARQIRSAGSGDVLALSRANGFVVTPVDVADLPTGSRVDTLSW
jgi:molybdopterin molybdotransferase